MKVTPEEYFNTQDVSDLTHEQYCNAIRLLHVINLLRLEFGVPFKINSGYRSLAHNLRVGGSANSHHIYCRAIDIADPNGLIKGQLMANNNELLIKYNLFMEDPSVTKTWAHLQIVPPRSGARIFMP